MDHHSCPGRRADLRADGLGARGRERLVRCGQLRLQVLDVPPRRARLRRRARRGVRRRRWRRLAAARRGPRPCRRRRAAQHAGRRRGVPRRRPRARPRRRRGRGPGGGPGFGARVRLQRARADQLRRGRRDARRRPPRRGRAAAAGGRRGRGLALGRARAGAAAAAAVGVVFFILVVIVGQRGGGGAAVAAGGRNPSGRRVRRAAVAARVLAPGRAGGAAARGRSVLLAGLALRRGLRRFLRARPVVASELRPRPACSLEQTRAAARAAASGRAAQAACREAASRAARSGPCTRAGRRTPTQARRRHRQGSGALRHEKRGFVKGSAPAGGPRAGAASRRPAAPRPGARARAAPRPPRARPPPRSPAGPSARAGRPRSPARQPIAYESGLPKGDARAERAMEPGNSSPACSTAVAAPAPHAAAPGPRRWLRSGRRASAVRGRAQPALSYSGTAEPWPGARLGARSGVGLGLRGGLLLAPRRLGGLLGALPLLLARLLLALGCRARRRARVLRAARLLLLPACMD